MNYEIITNTEFFAKIRLRYGVIIDIYKCDLGKDLYFSIKNKRKDLRKINDYMYESKVDIKDIWHNSIYPIGTKVFKSDYSYRVINSICNSKEDWTWELKTAGTCFSGNTKEFSQLISIINQIIANL